MKPTTTKLTASLTMTAAALGFALMKYPELAASTIALVAGLLGVIAGNRPPNDD